jgi:hypothetical protein
MQKFCQMGLVFFGLFVVTGCGPSTPTPPSEEKIKEMNAAMDADMKSMTGNMPKKPGGGK